MGRLFDGRCPRWLGDGLGWAEPAGWVAGCLDASPRTGHTRPVAMAESFYDGCADYSWGKSKFSVEEWGSRVGQGSGLTYGRIRT